MSTNLPANPPGIAESLVLLWVKVYTAGLAREKRERRIGQIHLRRLGTLCRSNSDEGTSQAVDWARIAGSRRARSDGRPVLALSTGGTSSADSTSRWNESAAPFSSCHGGRIRFEHHRVRISTRRRRVRWRVAPSGKYRKLAGKRLHRTPGARWDRDAVRGSCAVSDSQALLAGPAIFAAVALAAAGLLTLVNAALYTTAAGLADEYVVAIPEHRDAALTVGRAFVLMLATTVLVMAVMLALGVYGFALIAARHRLVPRWLSWAAGGSLVAMVAAMVTDIFGADDSLVATLYHFPWPATALADGCRTLATSRWVGQGL